MFTRLPIRVLAADEHEIVRLGIKALLSEHQYLTCVGYASSGNEAIDLASQLRPDVLITDIKMPLPNGLEVTTHLATRVPETKVLIFSKWPSASLVVIALQAGASGCVSKASHQNVLIQGISAVATGKRFIDPQLADTTLSTLLDNLTIAGPSLLTKRERQVLILVAWGHTNSGIAINIGLSIKTVECYRARACVKLGFSDRPAIVKFAAMSGWME